MSPFCEIVEMNSLLWYFAAVKHSSEMARENDAAEKFSC